MPHQARDHADVVRRGSGVRRHVQTAKRFVCNRIAQRFDVHQQERFQLARVRDDERCGNRRGQYQGEHGVTQLRSVVQQADDDRSRQEQVGVARDVPRLYHALQTQIYAHKT